MYLDLGTLTLDTGASPAANISVNTRPDKLGSDKFQSGTDTWVRNAMERMDCSFWCTVHHCHRP